MCAHAYCCLLYCFLCVHIIVIVVSQPLHSAVPDRGSALLRSVGDYEEEVGCLISVLFNESMYWTHISESDPLTII